MKLLRSVKTGTPLTWQDVEIDPTLEAVRARREMEATLKMDRSVWPP